MSSLKPYKGYSASLEVDVEAGVIHGRVQGLRDVVSFEAGHPSEVVPAFHEAVDDYLVWCKELGREPERPYSGSFLVRMSPEEHKLLARAASAKGCSINAYVREAVAAAIGTSRMEA